MEKKYDEFFIVRIQTSEIWVSDGSKTNKNKNQPAMTILKCSGIVVFSISPASASFQQDELAYKLS